VIAHARGGPPVGGAGPNACKRAQMAVLAASDPAAYLTYVESIHTIVMPDGTAYRKTTSAKDRVSAPPILTGKRTASTSWLKKYMGELMQTLLKAIIKTCPAHETPCHSKRGNRWNSVGTREVESCSKTFK
jgi:hypothetical protein